MRNRSSSNSSGFSRQMDSLLGSIDRIESNISSISRFHEKALVGVSQEETSRITRQLDQVQDETNELMNNVRVTLKKLSDETKRLGGSEAQSRKAQQSSVAMKLQNSAQRYAQVQKYAKEQYKKRMEREIRIGRCICVTMRYNTISSLTILFPKQPALMLPKLILREP